MSDAVIVSAARTPYGSFNGSLSPLPATRLGAIAIEEAIKRGGLQKEEVEKVIMGNVLSAGLGQAPARQAALAAGLPNSVGTLTINKVCGSGVKAIILAAQSILTEDAQVLVAGGMESMSNAPYLLMKARGGYRMGHGELVDSIIKDGLWDVYNDIHMGDAAELCGDAFQISREEQDQFAINSYRCAKKAQERGELKREIVPVAVPQKVKGVRIVEEDEGPHRVNLEKLTTLKPAFKKNGKITAGNASSLSDGAGALVIMSEKKARDMGKKPRVKIVGYSEYSTEPTRFSTAPCGAISSVLKKTGYNISEIDLFEINEAFSVATIAVNKKLGLDPDKVNIRGGAVALGHPIGATGAMILTTLIHSLEDLNLRRGIVSLCIGGGEAVAMLLERRMS